eukprot:SAG11_NODE_12437_length_703_cov_1.610927_1_plen_116_part_00
MSQPAEQRADRLRRFDSVPWQLWDLRSPDGEERGLSAATIAAAIVTLHARKEELVAALPLYLPSLGLLHDFGARLRDRLEYAHRIAADQPALLAARDSRAVASAVYKLCFPEWEL